MNKKDLLKLMNDELLEKLYGFCYARTNDSYEAQDLCSDIVLALVKAAGSQGTIDQPYPFIWRIARNIYADFAKKRRLCSELYYGGDADEALSLIAAPEPEDDSEEQLLVIYRRIAFLTKAYREVMILFYLNGLSTAEIAVRLSISETAVRQRLFAARNQVRSEVTEMTEIKNKPITLNPIDFEIWGTGNPHWGDPTEVCTRQFSKHILWLCYQKPSTAAQIADELNVPTIYVEEELEILTNGKNGEYGLLRRLSNGRYAINFVLLDQEQMEKAIGIYTRCLPDICKGILEFIEAHREEYLAFPYLNKKVDMNLILWQQIHSISHALSKQVEIVLEERYFAHVEKNQRPFSVFGYVDNGNYYGCGWDGISAQNICGYSLVSFFNIYINRIKIHFHCGHDIANDPQLHLALRAIDGLSITGLNETEKEHAAKAIDCGYLYREGDMLFTKLLTNRVADEQKLFAVTEKLKHGYPADTVTSIADQIAELIRSTVPEYLLEDWRFVNHLASAPLLDLIVEELIQEGVLTPPKDGIGAEGCWMMIE